MINKAEFNPTPLRSHRLLGKYFEYPFENGWLYGNKDTPLRPSVVTALFAYEWRTPAIPKSKR